MLRTFDGLHPTREVLSAIGNGAASGVTLFRAKNVGSPGQLRALAAALQAARPPGDPPLVIGLDQEGGQLQAVGGTATAWPGNLALGATRSEALAEAAGLAIGREAAAMGATLVFAPVCDVLRPASATPLGIRSFGSDPALVARLAAALVRGLQAAGVAAVLKHFPGHGSALGDSHLAALTVSGDAATIRERDLPAFRAGIDAGVACVLPGHLAAPALTGGRNELATVSRTLLRDLLRAELGFAGVTVSDALDMGGAGTADGLEAQAVAAAAAGMDLLLLVHPSTLEDAVVEALASAIADGHISRDDAEMSRRRIEQLRSRFGDPAQPPLDVVGCAPHLELARRIADASITLVRDPRRLLPLRSDGRHIARIALVAPHPIDLTPAETSSYIQLGLADELRARGLVVTEHVTPLDPTPAQAAAVADAIRDVDLVLVGTFDAISNRGQIPLVEALAAAWPTVAVALRSPYDAALLPATITVACTYGMQRPQMAALAAALLGDIPFVGRLPIELPIGAAGDLASGEGLGA